MAFEDFRRPGDAPWSVNEIQYGEIAHDRVRDKAQLLYLLAAASFTEMTSDLYTHNLVAFFREDREAVEWLQQRWEPEELQHGLALKRYVLRAWPNFDWDAAYRPRVGEPYSKNVPRLATEQRWRRRTFPERASTADEIEKACEGLSPPMVLRRTPGRAESYHGKLIF